MLALLDKQTGINRGQFELSVALPINAKIKPALVDQGINCIELPFLAESSFSRKAVQVLLNEMKNLQPDIVHTHAALSGRIAAWRYGKCKIVHTRHSVFEPARWKTRFPFRQVFGMINNRLSHKIIAVSPAAKDNLTAIGTAEEKFAIIYNGMPPAKEFGTTELTVLREKYNIPKDAFVLAQIARLTHVKGQDDVLDAVKDLPNTLVLMAGDGENRPHLEARIQNEGITNVRLLGFVTEVEELLAVMDAQLSASFGTEATSLALIQGMSVGKPAIATNYGGNPYVISHKENGLLVPTRNPQALKNAICLLQNDTELYVKTSAGARKIYQLRFTVEEMVSKTEQLYKELLSYEKY